MNRSIILASTSPRRIEILKKTDLEFKAVAPKYEEEMHLSLPPLELAKYLALKKAESIADQHPDAIIISGDTFVSQSGVILGKPKTAQRAKEMLGKLSGAAHSLITGFAVIDTTSKKVFTEAQETIVHFRKISSAEIDEYVATGEPLDKAGAYAIQGGAKKFVEAIEGDYLTIVGLPLERLIEVLKEFGISASQKR